MKIVDIGLESKMIAGSDATRVTPDVDKLSLLAPLSYWNTRILPVYLPIFDVDPVLEKSHLWNSPPARIFQPEVSDMIKDVAHLAIEVESVSPPVEHVLEWDWDIEHADRKKETEAGVGATPFEVDRRVLKDIVREKVNIEVGRIKFLSAGTFHKAYLVTLVNGVELVARVGRRFMPRLKTESEVATMEYLREYTHIPVPTVYHYDSNPYNRLGGEWILMSKASGIPLSQVYHSLGYNDLVKLLTNLAELLIPLFAHRFSKLGSLYFGQDPQDTPGVSATPTPKAVELHYSAFPFTPTLTISALSSTIPTPKASQRVPPPKESCDFHVGPIISWPFFGSNRGDLTHPIEINRGPWASTQLYLESCREREINGVIRENEGKSAPHRLHLDPDEIHASRHHHLRAVPDDQSDDSDEWDLEESETEWDGPGDMMYRDYRRLQRSTFLVAHIQAREKMVNDEMDRWVKFMEKLLGILDPDSDSMEREEFGLDCHDLSLENVFVDPLERHKITCIIDWESTTTRPLWQCAHLPAFLTSSPFTAKLFREIVVQIASGGNSTPVAATPATPQNIAKSKPLDMHSLAREWLHFESAGSRLRMAHRVVEWDGWEEGLVEGLLGAEEYQDDWFKDRADASAYDLLSPPLISALNEREDSATSMGVADIGILGAPLTRRKLQSKLLPFAQEMEKEQVLNTTGDICGGRGGELGRRLEAWLTVNGHLNGTDDHPGGKESGDTAKKWLPDEKDDELITV